MAVADSHLNPHYTQNSEEDSIYNPQADCPFHIGALCLMWYFAVLTEEG